MFSERYRRHRLALLAVISLLVITPLIVLSGPQASSEGVGVPEDSTATTEPQRASQPHVDLWSGLPLAEALHQAERDRFFAAVAAEEQRQKDIAIEAERQRKAAAAAAAKKAQQQQAAAAKKAAAPAAPVYSGGSVWDDLAQCESHGNWSINTGNGYYGGLQMDMTFWNTYGNSAYARADLAPRGEQIAAATKARDSGRGYYPWPTCARKLGLI